MKKFNLLLRLLIGGVFVYAALLKITVGTKMGGVLLPTTELASPEIFAASILNYRLLPHPLVNLLAITLPWIELVAGALLMIGLWKRSSAFLITLMMVVFLVAIGQAVARNLNIDCGCFGTQEGRKVGLIALAGDGGLFLASVWLTLWYKD